MVAISAKCEIFLKKFSSTVGHKPSNICSTEVRTSFAIYVYAATFLREFGKMLLLYIYHTWIKQKPMLVTDNIL